MKAPKNGICYSVGEIVPYVLWSLVKDMKAMRLPKKKRKKVSKMTDKNGFISKHDIAIAKKHAKLDKCERT